MKPLNVPLAEALAQSAPLAALLARVHESEQRLAAVRDALPAGLVPLVRPGPLDETGWTLLVPGNAAAAKLRQCLPTLEGRLRERGFSALPIRVKVQRAQPR